MGTAIERREESRAVAAVYETRLAPVTPALQFATQLRQTSHLVSHRSFAHSKAMVLYAATERGKFLAKFGRADAAARLLRRATAWDPPDRKTAGAMIGTMLGAFGAKADRDVLAGMLDMIESDQTGIASGLWEPMHLSPVVLALACRKLIVTATFTPKPCELHAACRDARRHLLIAEDDAEALADYVRRCDALLLEFARDEWAQPYQIPEYRAVLERMLELHAIVGDGSEAFDDDHPFAALVKAEQRKLLALPSPKPRRARRIGLAPEPTEQPKEDRT